MNSSARQLRFARTYRIGVLIGAGKSPYTANLLSEIEKCLQEQGYAVTFAGQNLSPERVLRFANYLLTQGVDGMIVWPVFAGLQSMELLRGENVPVVMLEENWEGSPFDCVQVDCSKGTYDLADSACQLLLDQITNGIPAKRRVVRIPGEIQYRDSVRNLLESETAMPTPSSEIRR